MKKLKENRSVTTERRLGAWRSKVGSLLLRPQLNKEINVHIAYIERERLIEGGGLEL